MKKMAMILILALVCSLTLTVSANNGNGKGNGNDNNVNLIIEGDVIETGGCDDDGDGLVTISECINECGGTAVINSEGGVCLVGPE